MATNVDLTKIVIKNVCPYCGVEQAVTVRMGDFHRWEAGAFTQDAFPYLSPVEREVLISGICPKCWDSTFGVRGDDDPDWDPNDPNFDW